MGSHACTKQVPASIWSYDEVSPCFVRGGEIVHALRSKIASTHEQQVLSSSLSRISVLPLRRMRVLHGGRVFSCEKPWKTFFTNCHSRIPRGSWQLMYIPSLSNLETANIWNHYFVLYSFAVSEVPDLRDLPAFILSYFSSPRNGYPPSLDPRFSAFKPGAATPFVGLMAPLGSSSSTSPTAGHPATTPSNTKDSSESDLKPGIPTPAEAQQALFANFGLNAFSHPLPGGVPFLPPLVDMSSTQALLNMVRTASAQSANQLETYLKGAIKRPPENSNNPLDLSSNAVTPPLKKARKHTPSLSESLYGPDALLNFPILNALQRTTKDRLQSKRTGSVSPKPKSKLATSPSNAASVSRPSTANSCLSLCSTPGEKPCSSSADTQTVAHWTVDDVCNFITSIDLCAEYAPQVARCAVITARGHCAASQFTCTHAYKSSTPRCRGGAARRARYFLFVDPSFPYDHATATRARAARLAH
ncbi:hypothetical protein J6590_003840 [Homalodisca vitripennis]|nr:hypothetical protein J6590_003840 [Homalodisca vitripennis]